MRTLEANLFPAPLIVLVAHDALQASNDAATKFKQESNFFYLTRINEPGWRLIIDVSQQKQWLVAPDIDEQQRLFDGALGHDEARRLSGVNEVISFKEGEELLETLAKEHESVAALGEHPHRDHFSFVENPSRQRLWDELSKTFKAVVDCRKVFSKLRAIKSEEEVASIQAAINVSIEGFNRLKRQLSHARHEYELEAELNHAFRVTGAEGHAYDPIVASAGHACTLHYGENNDELPENGLVLIDAGAQIDGYAADITRTYAVGEPTERQKAVHAAVEKAHHDIVDLLKPGLKVKTYSDQVDAIMKDALRSLDLLKSDDDYRKYFPHAISHGLGIDVHDSLGGAETLESGMVLTVEPGIYIPEEDIGVRIEDDILITDDGHRNLSGQLSTGL